MAQRIWNFMTLGAIGLCSCGALEAPPAQPVERPPTTARAAVDLPPCLNPGDPTEEAYFIATGPTQGDVILPNGRRITPLGEHVEVGVFPLNAVTSADGRYAFVSNSGDGPRYIQQIALETAEVVATLRFDELFHGLALDPTGSLLYAAGGEDNVVYAIAVGDPGLTLLNTWQAPGYPVDIALTADGRKLFISSNLSNTISELDTSSGEIVRTFEVAVFPYQLQLGPGETSLYVSQWTESAVSVVDLATGALTATISTGKNPSGMALGTSGRRLYVTTADGDRIEVFDTQTHERTSRTSVGIYADGLHGASPNSLTLSADGRQLYVANAGDNAIEVYDPATMEHLGAIPTAWYPTAVKLSGDGGTLVVVNGKGAGAGPTPNGIEASDLMDGVVSLIPLPLSTNTLIEGHIQVKENNQRPQTLHEISCQGKMFPVPSQGSESPIEHVVLIVRENKTYDAYLGDLEIGDGDPAMVLFGEEITPNTHQLAREFTLLDNFYTDSEDSDQGHLWLTGGFVNDYVERLNAAKRTLLTGVSRGTDLKTHYIFNALLRAGVDWTNYGEVVGLELATWHNIDLDFPGYFYNMKVKDQRKAEYVASQIHSGVLAPFTYLLLPNDHTQGTKDGELSPESMVSDNDYAVGLVVEAITQSEFWPTTAIFIIEDDPQNGADHVEAHRSPAIVVSPWAKRGHVSSVTYSIPSILKTIELILDVPPMTQYDALALPMYDCFTAVPDYTPYDVVPRQVEDTYNTKDTPGAARSALMDFSGPDRARGLGEVLWRYRKGTEPPLMFGAFGLEGGKRAADRDEAVDEDTLERLGIDADDDADEGAGEGGIWEDWHY